MSAGNLNKIENGQVKCPSASILYEFAVLFDIEYVHLMRLSGHWTSGQDTKGPEIRRVSVFDNEHLSRWEILELRRHLALIRGRLR